MMLETNIREGKKDRLPERGGIQHVAGRENSASGSLVITFPKQLTLTMGGEGGLKDEKRKGNPS